jgi:hypothetical protein
MICEIVEQVLFEEAGIGVSQPSSAFEPDSSEIRSRQ